MMMKTKKAPVLEHKTQEFIDATRSKRRQAHL